MSDYRSGINFAKLEEKKEIAIKMLKRKTPIEIISEDTGLDIPIIGRLQLELIND